MTFSEHFKTLRNKSGMTQAQLSDKSGVPQTTISGIENSGKIPTYFTARKLAKALQVDMNDFADREVAN